jgi:hypothetical protein
VLRHGPRRVILLSRNEEGKQMSFFVWGWILIGSAAAAVYLLKIA